MGSDTHRAQHLRAAGGYWCLTPFPDYAVFGNALAPVILSFG